MRFAGRIALVIASIAVMWGSASAAPAGHYLFAWAGDASGKGEDFLAVIDADPASPTYGKPVASAASGIKS
jgi:hypothetical protein